MNKWEVRGLLTVLVLAFVALFCLAGFMAYRQFECEAALRYVDLDGGYEPKTDSCFSIDKDGNQVMLNELIEK